MSDRDTDIQRLIEAVADLQTRVYADKKQPDLAKILDDLADLFDRESLEALVPQTPSQQLYRLAKGIKKIREDNFGERGE